MSTATYVQSRTVEALWWWSMSPIVFLLMCFCLLSPFHHASSSFLILLLFLLLQISLLRIPVLLRSRHRLLERFIIILLICFSFRPLPFLLPSGPVHRERINGDLKRVIWDCSLQSDSGHPFSSPLSKNSRNTVYKLRFANVLGRINGDLKRVIWDCSLQSDSEHPIFSPLSKNSRNTVYKLRWDPPSPIIQGIWRLQSISSILSPPVLLGTPLEGLSEPIMEFPAALGVFLTFSHSLL